MNRIKFYILFLLLPSLIYCSSPTDLDTTFNTTGYNSSTIQNPTTNCLAQRMARQSDGKVITAGQAFTTQDVITLNRYNTDGTLDSSFGINGYVITTIENSAYPTSIAIQADDKILITGKAIRKSDEAALIIRYNPNGSIDTTFGTDGKILATYNQTTNIGNDIKIHNDGKIVIVGAASSYGFIARYSSDGSPDQLFGDGGFKMFTNGDTLLYNKPYALDIRSDGSYMAFTIYNNSNTYSTNLVSITSDGQITDDQYNIKLDDASKKLSFGGFLKQPNGKYLGAGTYKTNPYRIFIVRWNSDGSKDTTFGGGKAYRTHSLTDSSYLDVKNIILDEDNKIVVTGYCTFNNIQQMFIARYYINGDMDTSFNNRTGYIIKAIEDYQIEAYDTLLDNNKKFLITGQFTDTNSIQGVITTRLADIQQEEGPAPSLDLVNFNDSHGYNVLSKSPTTGRAIAKQSNGKFIVAGQSGTPGTGNSVVILARYTIDGELDTTFGGYSTGYTSLSNTSLSEANAITIDSQDRILISGTSIKDYSNSSDEYAILTARYTKDGVLDTTFNKSGYVQQPFYIGYVNTISNIYDTYNGGHGIAVQPDGKIVVSGTYGHDNIRITRYNDNGTLDTSFSGDGYAQDDGGGYVRNYGIHFYSNDKIAALFSSQDQYSSAVKTRLFCVNKDGSSDENIDRFIILQYPNANQTIPFAMAVQQDNKFVIAGVYFMEDYAYQTVPPSTIYVTRCTSNGSIDTNFGSNNTGFVSFSLPGANDLTATNVEMYQDNKILVTGYATLDNKTQMVMIRYNQDGSLDTTFAPSGYIVLPVSTGNFTCNDSYIDSTNNKIIAAGTYTDYDNVYSKITIAQFDNFVPNTLESTTTTLDSNFNGYPGYNTTTPNTPTTSQSNSVAQQSDGKIISVGQTEGLIIVTRHNTNGTLDTTFGTDGYITTLIGIESGANAVAIQSDNKIVIAGYTVNDSNQNNLLVARYTSNGALDTSFNNGSGYAISLAYATDSRVQAHAVHVRSSDGKITITGTRYASGDNDLIIIRYNSNGSLDTSFDNDGIQIVDDGGKDLTGVAIGQYLTDKTAVLYSRASSNYTGTAIFAMDNDGSSANQFDDNGKKNFDMSNTDHTVPADLIVDANGKLLMVGSYYNNSNTKDSKIFLKRCDYKGSMDSGFGSSGTATFALSNSSYLTAASINLYSDGKIAVTGSVLYNSQRQIIIIRFNSNGTLDTSLNGTGYKLQSLDTAIYAYDSFIDTNKNIIVSGKKSTTSDINNDIILSGEQGDNMLISRFTYNGTLDTTFNTNGYNKFVYDNTISTIYAVTQQSNGKTIAAGQTNNSILLSRYHTNGTLDTSFGSNGYTTTLIGTECGAHAVTTDDDDHIFVTGYTKNSSNEYNIFLTSYEPSGSSFTDSSVYEPGLDDQTNSSVNAYAISYRSSDSKITIAGTVYGSNGNDLVIMRYNTDESLDTTFNNNGVVLMNKEDNNLTGIAIGQYREDKTAVLYSAKNEETKYIGTNIYCLDNDGSSANEFDDNGKKNFDMPQSYQTIPADLAVQPDNKMIFVGTFFTKIDTQPSKIFIQRCTYTGALDSAFGEDGRVTFELNHSTNLTATSVGLYEDGKIGVTGFVTLNGQNNIIVIRYNSDGTLDYNFSPDGYILQSITEDKDILISDGIITQDQKVICGGQANDGLFISRFETMSKEWEIDNSFNRENGYKLTYFKNAKANAIGKQSDGKIICAGQDLTTDTTVAITRYNTDGTIDTTFGENGFVYTQSGLAAYANSITIANDNSFVIAGYANDAILLTRYTANGSLDTTFGNDGITTMQLIAHKENQATDIKIQSNGKLVVIGNITNHTDDNDIFIARYHTDGSLDKSFGTNGYTIIENAQTQSLTILADESFVLFYNSYQDSIVRLVKLFNNGMIDVYSSSVDIANDPVIAGDMLIQPDGKYLCTGTILTTPTQLFVIRWNSDLSSDTTFGNGTNYRILDIDKSQYLTSTSINLQYDNKIVVTGNVTIDNQPHIIFVRYLNDGYNDGKLDTSFSSTGYITTTISSTDFTTYDSFIDTYFKWVLTGKYTNNDQIEGFMTSRFVGNNQELQQSSTTSSSTTSTSSTTSYGTNANNIENFLPFTFIAKNVVGDDSSQRTVSSLFNAVVNTMSNIIKEYKEKFKTIPNFNYIKHLYVLNMEINKAQNELLEEFPTDKAKIIKFFNKVRYKIDKLTGSSLLPL